MTSERNKLRKGAAQLFKTVPGFEKRAAKILTDEKNARIKIHHKGAHVLAADLKVIASKIRGKSILFFFDKDKQLLTGLYTAKYFPQADMLVTNFKDTNTKYPASAIVHEAVHMVNDLRVRKGMTKLDDEIMAWTVQAMYLRLQGMKADNVEGATNRTLLPAAFAVADSYLANRLPEDKTVNALARELLSLPTYAGIDKQLAEQYGGIK